MEAYRCWRRVRSRVMIARKNLPKFAAEFSRAFEYAAKIHANQVRKETGIPYVSHLIAVAGLVLENGGGEEEAIAALLHDAAEDCGGRKRLEQIERRFGPKVARIVDGCTDTYEDPKPPWKPRKEKYLRRLPGEPRSVRLVSSATPAFTPSAGRASKRSIPCTRSPATSVRRSPRKSSAIACGLAKRAVTWSVAKPSTACATRRAQRLANVSTSRVFTTPFS